MLRSKRLLVFLFAASVFSACSKNENPPIEEPDETPKTSIVISGGKFKANIEGYNDSIPAYWVDGIEKQLPNFKITSLWANSEAIGVSKTGKLHYIICGKKGEDLISQYWIDGVEQTLPPALAGSVIYIGATVQNEKFHVIGYGLRFQYWIDGVEQPLSNNVGLYDISLSTDGVYVGLAGRSNQTGFFIVNGVSTALPGSLSADKIAIVNGTVYVVGEEFQSALLQDQKYWVAGVKHDLPNSTHDFSKSAMTVSNGKVHVIAKLYNHGIATPKYWIDGVAQSLPKGATQLNDITEFEGKVYILGLASDKPTYWIDGVAHNLPGNAEYVNKIIVVKK